MKTKQNMFFSLLLCLVLLISLPLRIVAQNELSWYFKKNSEHKQPLLDSGQTFIEGYHCYYVDKNHGDDCDDKVIYLTFDAGYENGNVEKILDTLKAQDVKAAFFVLSHLISADTELVRRMADEGHLVCNHTMSHKNMTLVKTKSEFEKELLGLEALYSEKIGGEMPKFYRPPEGRISEDNLKILEEMGYKTILWSFAYADWDNANQMSCERALEKLNAGVHNGEILLLHPTSATNAAILGEFLEGLKRQGYRFGTLDEL